VQKNHAFGAGIHFCLGAPLARMEMQIALKAVFERHPNLRITSQPKYANVYHFHGLEALWVQT
jgi:unspecific monooxygenase